MDRDIADIKRNIERLTSNIERIVSQTDTLEEELRMIRTLLEKQDEREENRDNASNDTKKW